MPGGRSRETEKVVKKLSRCFITSGRLQEFLKQCFTKKQNGYFLNGRLREVVAMRQWIVHILINYLPSKLFCYF